MNRRELLKAGLYSSAAMLHLSGLKLNTWAFDDNNQQHSPAVTPFQVDLPLPAFKTPVPAASLPGAPVFNDGIPTD
ncbi:MAG TPA: hypothetical protein VGV15_09940 [Terriglobales bacterium]|nr:hypothetical protein [Terriglobales bacterium]